MPDLAIKAENLSKRYRIGQYVGGAYQYRTLRDVLTDAMYAPFRRLRARSKQQVVGSNPTTMTHEPSTNLIWALKDVSFEVKQGEVVGIIGRNGAGKTTLLKVLSRITEPTKGRAEIKGRIQSLLEVGTGFHPELTGRENTYLSGAILGMTKKEIERKFDEIVDFSGIEKFIDTPVKRYSSGMVVRLGFAVAAHLEPEILLIDEVLAVGDVVFQKKCLGKMQNVTKEGRTVLFVSHNMGMIRSLCKRSILLVDGKIAADGISHDVVDTYLSSWNAENKTKGAIYWIEDKQAPGCDEIRIRSIRLLDSMGKVQDTFEVDSQVLVEVIYQVYITLRGMRVLLSLTTKEGIIAFVSTDQDQRPNTLKPGRYKSLLTLPGGLLNRTRYFVRLAFDIPGSRVLIPWQDYLCFTCVIGDAEGSYVPSTWEGVVAPYLEWSIERLD